jgi:hypothetical protein
MTLRSGFLAALLILPSLAFGQQISFSQGWKEQRFSMFSSNDYTFGAQTLGIRSDDTVSLLWSALPQSVWKKTAAQWDWSVEISVPPTDLTKKGGDDRNLSIYFLFLPQEAAQKAQNQGIRALLDDPDVRVLIYVWGGAHARGDVLPSPYLGTRGRTIVLRPSGTGTASERVDLTGDHQRAFGEAPQNLVGLAVSSDSDDTGGEVVGQISRLRIE